MRQFLNQPRDISGGGIRQAKPLPQRAIRKLLALHLLNAGVQIARPQSILC